MLQGGYDRSPERKTMHRTTPIGLFAYCILQPPEHLPFLGQPPAASMPHAPILVTYRPTGNVRTGTFCAPIAMILSRIKESNTPIVRLEEISFSSI
jgi:hypothetical protein